MKYLNIILTIIAILLFVIFFKLSQLEDVIINTRQDSLNIINSNQGVIQSIQRLEESISGLRKQINDFSEKFQKK